MHRAKVVRGRNGWYYQVFGGSREVGNSEMYTRRYDAIRAVKANTNVTEIAVFNRKGRLVRTITR